MKKLITIVEQVDHNNVDARFYTENMKPVIGVNGAGEDYHLGQICSSMGWAKQDLGYERYGDELDRLFPEAKGNFAIEHKCGYHAVLLEEHEKRKLVGYFLLKNFGSCDESAIDEFIKVVELIAGK